MLIEISVFILNNETRLQKQIAGEVFFGLYKTQREGRQTYFNNFIYGIGVKRWEY